MVLVFHWAFRGNAGDKPSTFSYPAIDAVARYGYLGVELFFVISGFVILMSARSGVLRDFVVSRFVRLYPAFWVCCTLTLAVAWLIPDPHPAYQFTGAQYLVNMTMFSGFVGVPSIDGAYWSLFVEMRFYLMVAAVLALGWMGRIETLLWAWLIVATLQRVVRTGPLWHWLNAEYAPLFIAGAVLFLIHDRGWTPKRLALILGAWGLAVHQSMTMARSLTQTYSTEISPVIAAIGVTMIFVVMAAVASNRLRVLRWRGWLPLGVLTYPLYLLHQAIGYLILNRLGDKVPTALLFWGLALTMVLAAWGVHRLIEKPMASWLRGRLRRPRAVIAA